MNTKDLMYILNYLGNKFIAKWSIIYFKIFHRNNYTGLLLILQFKKQI